ncbi:autotransporter outer membrane beta-barrel domain-containing protein [Snodgrassella alvi]|uniref:autotransporter outer membrane beta-barrel domain-containing protein n=1 Tax=Snodgrassella alvi TaxID=1196083 RepID=UPI000C1ED3B1|nr:autotransporter outer membrane beta-barrel domain-containing protein [Snodgrassella alvi]PIT31823.1 hypothetical protein BHC50_08780 [Snodgrassella alvi]PIT36585.1 hypothetical protein BHC42_00225 [Snodgrassella alvi]WLT03914.1 autotransporter outer membrane beta-barrel domain-containing protein [Snodgrassella alvi]
MNNIYKSKWSEATQTWVACSELVRGKTKNNCAKIAAAVALALTSLGSYAADPAPCDNNAGSVVVSGTKCSLPSLPDDKTYTEISASGGAELIGEEGKKITAIGTTKVKKVINVDGGSTLNATNITTTNRVNSKGTNALAIAGSSIVDIDENLTATNMGNKADTIVNSGGSTLTVGKDLTINDEKGFSNGIQNIENSTIGAENITITSKKVGFSNDGILNKNNSVIDVKQNIDITSEGSDGNASIENTDGGKIKANNINIIQGGKNYAIHQTSENSSITVNNDLTIKSGNIPEGNSTIKIEGGKINVKGKTTINTHVDPDFIDDPKKVSAISITDGTYEANGGANINIKDNDEKNFEDAAGVIIGNKGIFENNGTLTVNGGKNTVIATDLESGEEATFTNKADGITTSHADTIVHNSSGILTVNNDGTLYSDGDSVLKNNKNGDIVVNNNEASSVINGNIINTKDGNITVNNKNSASTITGNITNQDNGTVTINNSGKIQNDNTRNKIENSGTGSMDITNTGTIASDILNGNTGDITINNNKTSSVVNGETDYTNPTTINGDIINNNDGNITVNNNESTSFIKGGITNSQKGSITINNSGSISGSDDTKKITNSNDGEIIINNNHEGSFLSDIENDATSTGLISIKNEGHVVSHISNKNTGIIQIINKDSFGGSIENTGDILINNYNAFGSTINNDGNGTIVINNNENSSPTDRSSIYGVINNNQSGNITVNNNGNESVIDSDINNNAENGNITVNNNTDSAIISGNITNSQAGSITINNSGLTVLYRKVTNSGAGKINITNNDKGNFQSAIDNDATSTGMITLNNEGTVNSKITNQNTGAIMIINNGTINGSITNTGTKNNVDNIWIDNNKDLNSTIENRDGSIVVNNNKEGSSFTGNIYNNSGFNTGKITVNNNEENTKINSHITNDNGDITINNKAYSSTIEGDITNINGIVNIKNSGKANYSKITNSGGSGSINIKNENAGDFQGDIDNDATGPASIYIHNENTFNSNITNQNTGTIDITNRGKNFEGSITNQNIGTIRITNDKTFNSNITNNNTGTITLNNGGEIASAILNGGAGAINITNGGTLGGYIKNKGTGSISLTNNDTVGGYIENNGTGSISLTNNGIISGSITNTGTKNNVDNIWIDNNKDLNSTIENRDGSIFVNNNKKDSSFTGNIYNNTGYITVNNNEEGTTINSHINNANGGSIYINNKAKTSTIEGDITNINASVKIENSGEANYSKITNSGGHINIDNEHEGNFQGDIDNDATGTGFIYIQNSGNTFNGSITNQNTGNIRIINDKIFNSKITNTGDFAVDAYNIKITNNKELNGPIENNGTGSIYIENTKDTGRIRRIRRITGNITNNNAGTITLDNNGEIASAILNGGAGAINIENNKDSFINGNITNSGAGNISIKNQDQAVLNGNIKNDGSGSITFTNNGDVDASVVNNTSVRINDTSLRQIQNIGNGTITIINNKTLNRPISNASEGTIGITNNGTMKTDITNTKSSTGEIEFINTQEFEGNLINANTGFISALNTKNFTGITDNSDSGKINLDNQGIWNNTGNSVLTKLQNTTGTIIFPKVSEVNAGDKDQYHTITVNGNYTGGGLMRVNTVWNKDGTSYSDRVDIHGDVDGAATTVQTLNGIYGDVTLKEIPIHSAVVVHVAGKSSGNDFTGSAPTTNAGEAQLKKIDTTSGTDYAWTLTAQNKTPEPTNPSVSGPTDPNISEPTDPNVSGPTDPNISEPTAPDKPILPAPPITEVPIYAEPVSGYVQMPTADMELGFTTIGTLHERRGENQTYNITGSNNTALGSDQQQTWGRVLVKHLDKDGKKRLNTAGNQSVLQIGQDFILDENEKTGIRRHIGGYVAYGHNENDFRDQYRAKNGYIVDDHYTGKGRTDAVSVGGYGTFYGNNGGYVDLVGQVTYLRNKYNARSNESVHQNGWGAALSAETGKSFIVYGNNWFVEPQAQLVYQYLSLDDFNDRIRHVDQHDPSALRGRVGMRFGYNGDIRDNLPSSSFYGIANIWHDFVNPKSVDIGRDNLKEEYAKTWGEVGLGIQLPITRQSNFYSDIRYEKNFGSDKRKGFKGTVGYKYTWL